MESKFDCLPGIMQVLPREILMLSYISRVFRSYTAKYSLALLNKVGARTMPDLVNKYSVSVRMIARLRYVLESKIRIYRAFSTVADEKIISLGMQGHHLTG